MWTFIFMHCHHTNTHMHGTMYDPSLASQPYFSAYAHARAKVGGGIRIIPFPRPLSHAHAHTRKIRLARETSMIQGISSTNAWVGHDNMAAPVSCNVLAIYTIQSNKIILRLTVIIIIKFDYYNNSHWNTYTIQDIYACRSR